MKPFYQDDAVVLYCDDFQNVIGNLAGFDLIVTDPPYGGEVTFRWDRWQDGWPGLLKPLASQMWCFGSMRMFMTHAHEFEGWKFCQDLIWEKHNGSGAHADRFRRVHEHVNHFYLGSFADCYKAPPIVAVTEDRRNGSGANRSAKPQHWNGIKKGFYEYDGTRLCRSVLYSKSCHGKALHPTEKPYDVLSRIIDYSCPPGGTVLDCFAGSGSTLAAAKAMGRRAVGIEANRKYCAVAADRLRQEFLSLK